MLRHARQAALLAVCAVAACAEDTPPLPPPEPPVGMGLVSVSGKRSVEQTLDRVEAKLKEDDGQSIVARIDHADEAVGDLPPTEGIVFGEPAVIAPLLRRNQLAGLDLPLTMLAWDEAADEATEVVHSTPEYIAERHGLTGAPELGRLEATLRGLVEDAAGLGATPDVGARSPAAAEGIVTRGVEGDVDEVVQRIERAAESSKLDVIDVVDHRRDARREGERLRPTTLVLIRDPRSEEELTSSKRTFAVDLPLRVLAYEDARGETRVAYNDAAYLARRHLVTGEERAVRRLGEQLEKVVREAG
ncbi:MAG: DUF302 domain-containing protein [Thermoleophilaceae bacterium]